MAHFTPIFILSLLLLATISNACNTCFLPSPPPPAAACPRDALKLGVCVDLLGVVGVVIGSPASSPCCALLAGLVDLDVALCLCTAIKANVLGINLNIPLALSAIISACSKTVPPGFKCE